MSRQNKHSNTITIITIIVSGIMVVSLVRNAIGLYNARHRLETMTARVAELEAKKKTIETQVIAETDQAAKDQAIRNKLNLAKPGETILIIPPDQLNVTAPTTLLDIEKKPPTPLSQWWAVLNPKS